MYEVANDKIGRVSRFNDFISQFSWATKPRPQQLVNFIDRLTSPLAYYYDNYNNYYYYDYYNCYYYYNKSSLSGP